MDETYSTQQMAAITGITVHTLRYYEKIDLLLDIARDDNGYRRFSKVDLEWFALQYSHRCHRCCCKWVCGIITSYKTDSSPQPDQKMM
ncbi:MAG: MerR family DNA-binding transcriptional regulator [Chloroflexi bacterium]|nr:MAG: MerR family DNA-binding transcriptional regulator [Chloroflexota bacterium]